MDHEHYDWSPIINRAPLRWPDNARVALCAIVNLDHFDWQAPEGSFSLPNLPGGIGPRPFPRFDTYGHRDYGHRVGIFRVLDTLEKHGLKATVAMDQMTAENYPYLVRHLQERGCEIIGHGVAITRMISSHMSEEEEREYILAAVSALQRVTGSAPAGWLSPEYGESPRTPQLLAAAGVEYLCDWTNDEQPYPMKAPQGSLHALPMMVDLDDQVCLSQRLIPVTRYGELLKESFDRLYQDGAETGRVMTLNLHPWLIGQPFRIKYLDDALSSMTARQGVWCATGREIIDWYRTQSSAS
jgi:peptidoglycan/xylan/chitin deacetylase (PgdA/CDA1 family)